MDLVEKTLSKEDIFEGKIIKVEVERVKLPNGKESTREIVRHQGGVAIIAFKDKETILMVEQFRKPINSLLLELPAGKIEKNEDLKKCAIRELQEETGYKPNKIEYIGKVVTSPGFCDEYIYIFKAEDLVKEELPCDDDEFINLHEYKLSEVKQMIKQGNITDAKTISAFMLI